MSQQNAEKQSLEQLVSSAQYTSSGYYLIRSESLVVPFAQGLRLQLDDAELFFTFQQKGTDYNLVAVKLGGTSSFNFQVLLPEDPNLLRWVLLASDEFFTISTNPTLALTYSITLPALNMASVTINYWGRVDELNDSSL